MMCYALTVLVNVPIVVGNGRQAQWKLPYPLARPIQVGGKWAGTQDSSERRVMHGAALSGVVHSTGAFR